jgi:hypothetical protein
MTVTLPDSMREKIALLETLQGTTRLTVMLKRSCAANSNRGQRSVLGRALPYAGNEIPKNRGTGSE